jgi:hypothetical protein
MTQRERGLLPQNTRITTVRLSNKTYIWWKANGGNLSHFVRSKIEEEMLAAHPLRHHTRFVDTAMVCFPHTDGGYCGICWPAGIPSRHEWADYRMAVNHEGYSGTWLEYQDAKINRLRPDFPNTEKNTVPGTLQISTKGHSPTRKGILRRLFNWLV